MIWCSSIGKASKPPVRVRALDVFIKMYFGAAMSQPTLLRKCISVEKTIGIFSVVTSLLLTACSGGGDSGNPGTTKGSLNLVPDSVSVSKLAAARVPFELVGSQGVVNQIVRFKVSDPDIAQVSPASCVVSSGVAAGCLVTITGKAEGSVSLIAESDGYESDGAKATITPANSLGTLTVSSTVGTTFYPLSKNQNTPWAVTVDFQATNKAALQNLNGQPLIVTITDPTGLMSPTPSQCNITASSTSCTFSGSWYPLQTNCPSPLSTSTCKPFNLTIGVAGYWQQTGKPFSGFTPIPVTFTPTFTPSPGSIIIGSQNASGQIYAGMKAPLFVELNGNTMNSAIYDVTLTIPPKVQPFVAFYSYPNGQNTSASIQKTYSQTCTLNPAPQIGWPVLNCAYGLYASPGTLNAVGATIDVAVTQSNQNPVDAALPQFNSTFNFLIVNPNSVNDRTISFTNNSGKAVIIGANNGTAEAYVGAGSLAGAGDVSCGTGPNAQQCPIGSTCVQGGASPAGNYQCYWDIPTLPLPLAANGGTGSLNISAFSGITTGNQQIQWSGNVYALPCSDTQGNQCPTLPSTPGTGPANNAQTIAEFTLQHNAVDYYDVSIINGVSNSLEFGPDAKSGKTSTSGPSPYYCGTAGSRAAQSNPAYNLLASQWSFAPSSSSFPATTVPSDSPSSYFAMVTPASQTNPTACTEQSSCSAAGSTGPVCGWDLPKVLSGDSKAISFASNTRVCGSFSGWATADQIWGWNQETQKPPILNQAPFAFKTPVPTTSINVGNLQLCNAGTFSSYQNPPGPNTYMACGGTNWPGIATPAENVVTTNTTWMSYVLPTITWLKSACPTCYTYAFDDQSSTFTCEKGINATGSNTLNYSINVGDIKNTYQ